MLSAFYSVTVGTVFFIALWIVAAGG
jgi:hypothetical protein